MLRKLELEYFILSYKLRLEVHTNTKGESTWVRINTHINTIVVVDVLVAE